MQKTVIIITAKTLVQKYIIQPLLLQSFNLCYDHASARIVIRISYNYLNTFFRKRLNGFQRGRDLLAGLFILCRHRVLGKYDNRLPKIDSIAFLKFRSSRVHAIRNKINGWKTDIKDSPRFLT